MSDTDKSTATQTIDDATTIADVDNIVADATANNLTNAKASATNEIGKLANLSEGDQTTYTEQANKATDVATVEKAVADAKDAAELALAEAQKAADTTIADLTYLSADELTDFEQQVTDATTIADVTQIVTEATNQNLTNAKESGADEIDGLKNLDDSQKKRLLSKLLMQLRLMQLSKLLLMPKRLMN